MADLTKDGIIDRSHIQGYVRHTWHGIDSAVSEKKAFKYEGIIVIIMLLSLVYVVLYDDRED